MGWFVRAVTCICVISVSLFRLVVGVVTVIGCWARLLSSLRASSSSIYRISMASALSNGSCGGTDFAGVIIFSTDASNFWEVCLVCMCSLPFVVCGAGEVVVSGFWPLVDGGSVSIVMWWSSGSRI